MTAHTAQTHEAAHHAYRKNVIVSILLTCVAYGYFNIGDATLKILGAKFHFSQILVFNGVVSIVCMAAAGWWKQREKVFVMQRPKLIAWRGVFSVIVSMLNIYAIPHVPLTTFYTLVFTSPLWVAVLAAIFLKEKLERRRLAVILAGFAVILYIFRPGGGMFSLYSLLVLGSAFFFSCTLIVTRRMGPAENRTMIVISGPALGILISLPYVWAHYIAPTPYEWLLFGLMGFLGAIGLYCIAYAFQNGPSAALLAPFHYTQIIWGALLGYFLFNETPTDSIIVGACVLIAAGLYLIFSETRRPPVVCARA